MLSGTSQTRFGAYRLPVAATRSLPRAAANDPLPVEDDARFEAGVSPARQQGDVLARDAVERVDRRVEVVERDLAVVSPLVEVGERSISVGLDLPREPFDLLDVLLISAAEATRPPSEMFLKVSSCHGKSSSGSGARSPFAARKGWRPRAVEGSVQKPR